MKTSNQNTLKNQTPPSRSGAKAETQALTFLRQKGWVLLERNFKTPGRGGGELDLIMRDTEDTLVFIEVRQRQSLDFGGAAASIGVKKQKHLLIAAAVFLRRFTTHPPCRFDVITLQNGNMEWIAGAFDASLLSHR